MKMKLSKKLLFAGAMALGLAGAAHAGPIIIAGTDADDHGSGSATENFGGWLFMQQAMTNIGGAVSNGNAQAVCLGCNGNQAGNAFNNAFNLAGLTGWNSVSLTAVTDITNFFNGSGAVNLNTAGFIYMPSDAGDTSGGISSAQLAPVDVNGTAINNFLSTGGGLFTQTQPYAWLTSLLPGLTVTHSGGSGLSLTAAGHAQFPTLTDADLSAGPWHNSFAGNFGALQSLAVDPSFRVPPTVVLGGGFQGGGGVIVCGQPGQPACPGGGGTVPEPGSMMLIGVGIVALAATTRRRRRQS